MKILLVVTGLPDKRSPARSVFNLRYAEELSNLGNTVTVLYLRAVKPGRSLLNVSNISGINVYEMGVLIPSIGFIKSTISVTPLFNFLLRNKKLKKILKEIDVVHAIHRNAIELSYLVSEHFKKPMISQFIGGNLKADIPYLSRRKNFTKGLEKSNYLCFNSKRLKDDFFSEFKGNFKTEVLYRGVKLEDFPFNFTKSSIVNVLFLGGFPGNSNLKGGLTLIEAIKQLDSIPLSRKVKFTIGGPNSLNFKTNLDVLENNNILIDFIGSIDKDLVKQKMSESHIVLIPSQFEGLPNVLYEAMSTGNMVIATDVGGIGEILENGKTGKLISPNNPTKLMNSILNSIENIDFIEKNAKAGRHNIEKLSYSDFIKGYMELYRQCVNN